MSVPNIRVTDLEAGLAILRPGVRYEASGQPFSAAYNPETGPITLAIEGKPSFVVEQGGHCSLPTGVRHFIYAGAIDRPPSTLPVTPLEPPFGREDLQAPGEGARIFAARMPTTTNPLPDIVPEVITFTAAEFAEESQLDLVFKLIRDNSLRPKEDRTHITHRLAEIAAIILLEHVLNSLKSDGLNAAPGVGDPQIRRALLAIHEGRSEDWTLERLAKEAGLSRSVFAERFKKLLDQTPMEYLTRVRMAQATRLLRTNDLSVSEIAFQSGYQSDASFHKAFKRMIGVSPNVYRRNHLKGD
ncbi:MAG: AraC family transcriptional regulator [Pseudomonadota bacterium]